MSWNIRKSLHMISFFMHNVTLSVPPKCHPLDKAKQMPWSKRELLIFVMLLAIERVGISSWNIAKFICIKSVYSYMPVFTLSKTSPEYWKYFLNKMTL